MIKQSITSMNPVGIIALFAALSEASAATALPFLHEDNQKIYVWFLIVFPSALTFLFFLTLNFNYKALYAPSDFSDEKNFLKTIKKTEPALKDSLHIKSVVEPSTGGKGMFSRLLLHPVNKAEVIFGGRISCSRDLERILSQFAADVPTVPGTCYQSTRIILLLKSSAIQINNDEFAALVDQYSSATQRSYTFALLTLDLDDRLLL